MMASDPKIALTNSQLIYLSPIKDDGSLSSCQAEVWYVMLGADIYVCTATSSWRARAPTRGVTDTRIWIGDLGYWKRADYRSLPAVKAKAAVEKDNVTVEAALQAFGDKYADEWGAWESRFRNGLNDGSRSMLRYRLSA